MSKNDWTYSISVHNTESVEIKVSRPDGTEEGDYPPVRFKSGIELNLENLSDSAAIRDVGERLFAALLGDGKTFLKTYQRAVVDARQPLQIVLEINEEALPEEFAKPWEFICIPKHQPNPLIWLATTSGLSFSRRLYNSDPDNSNRRQLKPIKQDETLKIALMVSRPSGKDADTERVLGNFGSSNVEDYLSSLQDQRLIDFFKASAKNVSARLREQKPHIFHFIGHGRLQVGAGQLAFVKDVAGPNYGKPDWKAADEVVGLFPVDCLPQVVILQACEGAKQSESDAFASVASKLLLQGIPIVVAMQYEIPAGIANQFVCRLYKEIAVQKNPVDVAVQEARNAIAQGHQKPEFATPVIYMNVADGQLFEEAIVVNKIAMPKLDLKELEEVLLLCRVVKDDDTRERFRNNLNAKQDPRLSDINFSGGNRTIANRIASFLIDYPDCFQTLLKLIEETEGKSNGYNQLKELGEI